jgi:TRAP-type C4-dicarboxylate transport system substrate-binding protein
VERRLPGRVKIDLFPGGSLGRHTQAYLQMVRDGVVDFAITIPSYFPGEFPDNDMFQLPLMFNNSMEASLTAWRMVQKNQLRGFEDIRVAAIYGTLPYGFHLGFSYDSLADLQGRKIRTMGLIQARVARALGAAPIGNIIAANLAETMDRGLVDGALFGWDNVRAFGVRYVSSHHVELPVSLSLAFIGMNVARYNSLPSDVRAVLDETMGEPLIRSIVAVTTAAGNDVRAEAVASGEHTLVDPDASELAEYRSRLAGLSDFYTEREPGNVERYRIFLETLAQVRREQGEENWDFR